MATAFDFSTISGLGDFWDGTGGKAGGGTFNLYDTGTSRNRKHNLDLLYQNIVGHNADPQGRAYWDAALAEGKTTYAKIADQLKGDPEAQGQAAYLKANPNATAADLKGLDTAYVSPFHFASGSAAANWRPGDKMTKEHAAAAATTTLDAAGNVVNKKSYDDTTRATVGDIKAAMDAYNAAQIKSGSLSLAGTGGLQGGVQHRTGNAYGPGADNTWVTTGDLTRALNANKGILGPTGPGGDPNGPGGDPSGPGGGGGGDNGDGYADLINAFASMIGNMGNNWGGNQTVGGVRTQNELPGWAPKKGGTSGFFGRGGRSGKGLTTSSLNI